MRTVRVNLGERGYDIAIVSGEHDGLGPFARQRVRGALAFVVGDNNTRAHADAAAASLTSAGFQVVCETVPAGEASKALAVASRCTTGWRISMPIAGPWWSRSAAASSATWPASSPPPSPAACRCSWCRPRCWPWSIARSAARSASTIPRGKNLIGAFHQPVGVWIDTATLATLPEREYRSGLAEVVKYGVILDAELLRLAGEQRRRRSWPREPDAVRHIVARCCRLKADVVEKDEREETGLRAVLNYGHTFAHAFETVGGYGTWLHGEAVAAGMVCASRLAERRGLIPARRHRRGRCACWQRSACR